MKKLVKKDTIDNLFVICPYHQQGCKWENPLSALDNHVKNDCEYFVVKCQFCEDEMERKEMDEHIKVTHHLCEFCNDIRVPLSRYENHLEMCLKKPVQCPYCPLQPLREVLEEHIIDNHYPCEFCDVRMEREEMIHI